MFGLLVELIKNRPTEGRRLFDVKIGCGEGWAFWCSERAVCAERAMAFTCCSSVAREQLRVSKAIDLQLEQWKRDTNRELKVLLVGMMAVLQYSTLAGHR